MHFYSKNRNNVKIIAASSSIFTLAIIFASSTTIFMTAVVATTTASNNTATGIPLPSTSITDDELLPMNTTATATNATDTPANSNATAAYTERAKEAAEETGILTKVTDQNAAAVLAEAAVRERQLAAAETVMDAMIGLNAESRLSVQTNTQIVSGVQQQSQAFDENAVRIAAQASGLQIWRDGEFAQAYFNVVETATALGFQGETTKANVVAMLEYIGTQERQNQLNEESVDTYFQLTDAQKEELRVLGITDEVMGQVALGVHDLSAEQAGAISTMGELGNTDFSTSTMATAYFNVLETATALGFQGETTKANVVAMLEYIGTQERQNQLNEESVDTYFQLTDAQKEELRVLGITDEVMGQVALGVHDLSAEQAGAISTMGELNDTNEEGEVVL